MVINDKIKNEKLWYDISKVVVKISELSSGKIDKDECTTGEQILPPQQHWIIERTSQIHLFTAHENIRKTNKSS